MLKIWGRRDGSNVIKVMWCVGELGLAHERIDWGGKFGGNDDPAYRAMNPMGRLPTLQQDDGFTLWESGAIVRYLCAQHSPGAMCPEGHRARAQAEKWMDWSSLYLAKFNSVYLAQFFQRPAGEHDMKAIEAAVAETRPLYDILDAQLARSPYLSGETLTMADIPAGTLTHRWMQWTPPGLRPSHANVQAWYERLCERPAYREHVIDATNERR
jgi:glutathione S-transferase